MLQASEITCKITCKIACKISTQQSQIVTSLAEGWSRIRLYGSLLGAPLFYCSVNSHPLESGRLSSLSQHWVWRVSNSCPSVLRAVFITIRRSPDMFAIHLLSMRLADTATLICALSITVCMYIFMISCIPRDSFASIYGLSVGQLQPSLRPLPASHNVKQSFKIPDHALDLPGLISWESIIWAFVTSLTVTPGIYTCTTYPAAHMKSTTVPHADAETCVTSYPVISKLHQNPVLQSTAANHFVLVSCGHGHLLSHVQCQGPSIYE